MSKTKAFKVASTEDKIMTELKTVRNSLDYLVAVSNILAHSNHELLDPIDERTARQFLKTLCLTTPFKGKEDKVVLKQNIVLASWGLLELPDNGDGNSDGNENCNEHYNENDSGNSNNDSFHWSKKVAERHAQFVQLFNYRGLTGNSANPQELNHTEDSLYKEIVIHYTDKLSLDYDFFKKALNGQIPTDLLTNVFFPIHNLPLEHKGFIGREDILEDIHCHFVSGKARIQIIYGINGIGKTELAKRYAFRYGGEYGSIIWIDGANAKTIISSLREFFTILDPELDYSTLSDEMIRAKYIEFRRTGYQCLTIIDNVDYMDKESTDNVSNRSLLERYLDSRHGQVLITTPYNEDFYGYRRIKVPGLTIAESEDYLKSRTGLEIEKYARELIQYAGGSPLLLRLYADTINQYQITYQACSRAKNDILRVKWRSMFGRGGLMSGYLSALNKLVGDSDILTGARNLLYIYYWLFEDNPEPLPVQEFLYLIEEHYWQRNEKPKITLFKLALASNIEIVQVLNKYAMINYENDRITVPPVVREVIKTLLFITEWKEGAEVTEDGAEEGTEEGAGNKAKDKAEDIIRLNSSWTIRQWIGEDIIAFMKEPDITRKEKYLILSSVYELTNDPEMAERYEKLAEAEEHLF